MDEFYNTRLGPEQFVAFRRWANEDPNIRLNLRDYDMQGWWLENFLKGTLGNQQGHFTDKYKKPNHPTFSKESIYSNDVVQGGDWRNSGESFWSFIPSQYQLEQKDYLPKLRRYFDSEYGRGINEVILPNERWLTPSKREGQ
jgi:hypothetical protein